MVESPLLNDAKTIRTAAGKYHRGIEVSDEDKRLCTSHYFEHMFFKCHEILCGRFFRVENRARSSN